jgi:hypothetical protein
MHLYSCVSSLSPANTEEGQPLPVLSQGSPNMYLYSRACSLSLSLSLNITASKTFIPPPPNFSLLHAPAISL